MNGVLKKFYGKPSDSPATPATLCLVLGRCLLACTVALVMVMPWTEYFWHFDRFLHGGDDCELGLLALLAVLCLVLLLFQQGKNDLRVCLTVCNRLRSRLHSERALTMPDVFCSLVTPQDTAAMRGRKLNQHSLPLQV